MIHDFNNDLWYACYFETAILMCTCTAIHISGCVLWDVHKAFVTDYKKSGEIFLNLLMKQTCSVVFLVWTQKRESRTGKRSSELRGDQKHPRSLSRFFSKIHIKLKAHYI